ncbi:MAG TPA: hypothetical protein DDW65_06425, partial [Firmicutes bacterium]|nr:hypothetical protein [Bacillota bacterium]
LPVVRPKEFKGTIRFIDFRDFPFVTAQVAGNITFQAQNQTAEQLLQQREICENLSLWIKAPALGPDQILFMDGTISDAQWDFETVKEAELEKQTECWVMELKVDYRWRLLITKELTCPESCTEPGSRVESIQSRLLQEHHIFTFSKILAIDFREFSQDIQLELEQVTYEHKLSKKGLLLSAKLTWGIIFINSDGVEEYRMYHTDFDELFPGYPEMAWDSNQNIITDHLTVRLQKFLRNRAQLELIIFGQYDAKIYQSKITPVLVDQKSAELIFAKTLVDKITFSFGAEKGLQLKYQFLRITGIKAKLLNLDAQPHRGWLRVSGILDVAISYFDRRRVLREDVFQIDVSNDYIWDKLISKMKIVISDSSNYDNYCIINGGLVYRYLITISAAAFEEKILRVATVNRQAKETEVFTTNDLAEEPVEAISPAELDLEKLGVEGEVLLAKGNAREIGTGRVWLSGFDYHYSQKAILIKGNLSGELEYWDEQRFLQKVLIDLPFWRFIQNTSGEPGRFRLNPEIKNCNYSPIKGSLWRKGSIKIDCELDLNPILAGDSG